MSAPRLIGSLTQPDEALLLKLVAEHLGPNASRDALVITSRLVAALGQRERLLGRLQEKLGAEERRANLAENTVRSMRGTGYDFRKFQTTLIKKACAGAEAAERGALTTASTRL